MTFDNVKDKTLVYISRIIHAIKSSFSMYSKKICIHSQT